MREILAAGWLALAPLAVSAMPEAPPAPVRTPPPEPLARDLSLPPALSDEMIRKAVRATIVEDPHPVDTANRAAGAFGTTAPTMHDTMTAAFEQAKVPDCLHGDALKLQPAMIGPIGVVGPYSLPWVIAAAIRGKCN
ncbi:MULTISPECIES: hypothetical protein [unclassified Duganella]|uniref:hypothetical protein n=1 Tax=unclassified Duganella TaxID=2636909 RepID=UPI000E3508F8|nr:MULTISPECIES: hypothetical protein [unclassified Duganella]RFP18825.1 hypothetical protein D0T23_03290 [Duganella sp. BJB475]RFP35490.1 hypothetical protein D0T21_03290 [Duganella sp. BJB476]